MLAIIEFVFWPYSTSCSLTTTEDGNNEWEIFGLYKY